MVKRSKKSDHILIGTVALSIVFGIIILASVATSLSQQKLERTYYYLAHQVLLGLIPGIFIAFVLSQVKLSFIKKWAPIILVVNLFLMTLVFLPKIGTPAGQAARWINLGPISFQPSELLKLSFTLYLATWLESRSQKTSSRSKNRFQENLAAFVVIIGLITLLLYFQSDISTLGVIVATGVLMYFFAHTPLKHLLFIVLLGAIVLALLIKFTPYRMERIWAFLNPEIDPWGISYQIEQALFGVGSGGIFGLGLGMSQQKSGLLPHPMSDSIFAVLAEETGFIGSAILVVLFLIFLWRGYKIGKEASNIFSRLTALGITSWIIIQAFINIGAMIGILPLTGIPLPFVSYGGSALITELAAVGILLNISKRI